MFDLKNNSVKRFDMTIPSVNFENENIILELGQLCNTDKNMYYYMGLVLLRLGFDPEDSVLLSNYDKENYSFDCVVNDECCYKIRIDKSSSEIVMNTLNSEFGYVCEEQSFSEIGMRISLGRYSINYPNGVKFTRYLSRQDMKFKVELSGCILELELSRPKGLELPLFIDGIYAKYKLDNEEDLVEYITGLDTNISLVDIYKKLYESYIGDISKYPRFMLRKSKKINGELKATDLILLKDGKLEQIGVTHYDRTVFLDKDDNWSYEIPMEGSLPVDFSMSFQDGKKTCTFSFFEDEEFSSDCIDMMDYIKNGIRDDVRIAMDEVTYVRRKVLEIFGNNKGSN